MFADKMRKGVEFLFKKNKITVVNGKATITGEHTVTVGDVLRSAMLVALKLSGPMLVLSKLVGVIVAIFQAVTQIHEQTLGFILKLIVVIGVMLIGGGWMMETLSEFSREVFALIAA